MLNGDPTIKQFGVGWPSPSRRRDRRPLPARARDAGSTGRAWWMPRWLDRRLPQVSVEGHGWFAERDAAAAAPAAAAQSGSPAK